METKKLLDFLLKKSGLKQAEIAEKMNLTRGTVSRWFNGVTEPTYQNIVRLCNACGFTLYEALKELEKDDKSNSTVDNDISKSKCPETKSFDGARVISFKIREDRLGEEALYRYERHIYDQEHIMNMDILITKEQFIECYNRWIKEEEN